MTTIVNYRAGRVLRCSAVGSPYARLSSSWVAYDNGNMMKNAKTRICSEGDGVKAEDEVGGVKKDREAKRRRTLFPFSRERAAY